MLALLTFLKIIGVGAAIGVYGPVVEFQNDGTNAVQEETVVGNHKKGAVVARQVTLEPLYHLKVEVVSGLVENEQVGLCEQHVGWRLLQITHTDIPAEDYLAGVVTFLACKD